MEAAKFNSIMLIGLVISVITFGGGFISTYVKIENRLAVIEFRQSEGQEKLDVIKEKIKDLPQKQR